MEDYRLEQTGQEVQRILNGAAMDANLQAEVERATDAEGTLQDNIDAEEQARQDADGVLQQGIDDEAQRAKDAEESNAGEIEGIKALIPSTATSANKLADTNYVNSSIQTATAEYRGDYNVVTDLHLAIDATHAQIETLLPTVIAEADKNDYCYVMIPTNASTPTEIAKIERYKMTSEGWKFEYDVNNSTFTAEEWAAIKSGITSGLVAKLNALPTNADLLLLLAGKQDVLTFDSVPVPESNNPVKSGGVYSAIDDEKTARLNSDTAIHAELDGLQAKVPATASSDNKLVDQNQMNTSISTATATYRGDWNVVSDLHLAVDATHAQIAAMLPTVIATADNNDYCYVEIPTSAETPTQIASVERYKFNGTAWGYEYVLNNSGFTAAQWAAINSMITSGLVAKLSALPTNADLLAMLAQKQDNLTFDTTPTENSTNPVTSGGVFAADKALSDAIEAILLLIPSAASALNKLVDTAQMNSSISTATATFRGTYNLVSDLGLGIDATEGQIAAALLSAISTADNNDYSFVQIPTSAQTPTQIARTDRYKFNGTAWAFEYTLNTSGFTAAQWAAINSTITSALVAKLNALPTAAELQEALGVLTSGITAINQKIPSTASQSNKLVDNASMESYIAQVINILDASFNVTSTDGHITLHITQVDGVITSVQVQSTDIASAADLALKASQADLTALASRVTTAEGNITSLTGRMGTAETNIANLQQLYNNLQQSKPVPVPALPSTGQQQGVIYRLAGTTSYSDYMWNGSSWVLMATYNNAIDPRPKKASQNLVTSGGVFDNIGALDVSELNATENPHTLAQYTDLSAALAAIPTDYQKGGMSIKFVQSDNKYVQYRLTSTNWSNIVSDWINVEKREIQTENTLDEVIPVNQKDNLVLGYQINASGIKEAKNQRGYFIVKVLTDSTELEVQDGTPASVAWYSGVPDIEAGTNFIQRNVHSDIEDKVYPLPTSSCKYAIITLHLGYPYDNVSIRQDGQLQSIVLNTIKSENNLIGKKVVFLGDSITAGTALVNHGYSLDKVYHKIFADLAKLSEHRNLGVGGSTIATKTNASDETVNTNRFKYRVTSFNFAGADLVVVFGGVNDADQDAYPIGDLFTITESTPNGNWGGHAKVAPAIANEGQTDEVAPFGAALHQLINMIYNVAPGVPILFITPLNTSYVDGAKRRPKSFEDNKNGDYMSDFRDAIHDVCDFYSIPVFDAHLIPQLNFCNDTFAQRYSFDGLHPNVDGNKLIGEALYKFVKDNITILTENIYYIGNIDFSELTTLWTSTAEAIWVNINYKGSSLYTAFADGVKYKADLDHTLDFVKINISTGVYSSIGSFNAVLGENMFYFQDRVELAENEYIGIKIHTRNSFSFASDITDCIGYGGFIGSYENRPNYCFPYDVFVKED